MRLPSPATAIALVALFVAVGGTAYAAATVTGRDIRNGTVTTADIKNRSLKAVDFRRGTIRRGARGATGPGGPIGPVGPRGLTGATGPAGPGFAGIERVTATSTSSSATSQNATVLCPAGKRAFAGGALITAAFDAPVALQESGTGGGAGYPAPGWFAAAREMAPYAGDWSVTVSAFCADI
jgi:hypothetical protein